jgi:colanic acid/amylovoran biosynthesis glycosyltransferase
MGSPPPQDAVVETGRIPGSALSPGAPAAAATVAYVMSRFPKLTETFILEEILAVEELGVRVELFPLLRQSEPVVHLEAEALTGRAHYAPFLSLRILASQLHYLVRRPRAYLGALLSLAARTLGSRNYFIGGLAVFPKVVHAARFMEERGVKHVHCHFANHPAAAGFVIHRLTGIPFSFTAHGSDLHRDRHMLREKVMEAGVVVTISDYNRRLVLDECGEEFSDKVVVVRCGVDTQMFRPRDMGRLPPAGRLRLVCIASFDEVKGQRYLVEACRLLVDAGIDVECRLVGDGSTRPDVARRVSRLNLDDRVRFEGRKTRREVADALAEADVAVCPSVWTALGDREGIPVALMEAMASGVPVVASNISGIPELVEHEHTGLLVPPGDAVALAEALRRLHEDRVLRSRLATAGRARALREHDVRASAIALLRHFMREGAPAEQDLLHSSRTG